MTTSNENNSTSTTEAAQYWNDHYTGACFLNNIRLVNTRQDPFLSVDVHVKQGKRDSGQKTKTQRINVNVVGARATAIVTALLEKYDFKEGVKSESNPKGHPPISAFFTIGDLWADVYISNVDQKPRATMKGRLVSLNHVYVENERFDTPDDFGDSPAGSTPVESKETTQDAPEQDASVQQDVDATASTVEPEESDREKYERLMAAFVESTLDSECIELDSNDPMYKPYLRFLINNGYAWNDDASAYVARTVAA